MCFHTPRTAGAGHSGKPFLCLAHESSHADYRFVFLPGLANFESSSAWLYISPFWLKIKADNQLLGVVDLDGLTDVNIRRGKLDVVQVGALERIANSQLPASFVRYQGMILLA